MSVEHDPSLMRMETIGNESRDRGMFREQTQQAHGTHTLHTVHTLVTILHSIRLSNNIFRRLPRYLYPSSPSHHYRSLHTTTTALARMTKESVCIVGSGNWLVFNSPKHTTSIHSTNYSPAITLNPPSSGARPLPKSQVETSSKTQKSSNHVSLCGCSKRPWKTAKS
jgi:hypothetical protein